MVLPPNTRVINGPHMSLDNHSDADTSIKNNLFTLFTAPFWKNKVEELLGVASDQGLKGFSRHLVMLAQGTFHSCPLCFKPIGSMNILRHFSTHFKY